MVLEPDSSLIEWVEAEQNDAVGTLADGVSRKACARLMRTLIDLINISPSVPLNDDVPKKVWTGKDVSYDHLRVFGYRAFVHIPKDERSKLDVKAKPCIFLGYGHEEFGYRKWDPMSRKIVRSRDVVFLED